MFCYHCPFEETFPQCNWFAPTIFNSIYSNTNPRKPRPSSSSWSSVPLSRRGASEGYAARIAEICRKHGILLIADEVMTGMGRTGKPYAVQHWGIEPDMILVGKGVASGYAPLGAVLVSAHVVAAFERGSGAFIHGFTYQAHPVSPPRGTLFSTTSNRTSCLIA